MLLFSLSDNRILNVFCPIIIVLFSLLLIGCSAEYHRERADREAYTIIEEKSEGMEGMPEDFTIEQPEDQPEKIDTPTERILAASTVISLHDAIEIAVLNSRSYQNRKESLYLQALSLSLSRHGFDPQFFATASGALSGEADGTDETLSGVLSYGLNKMMATGADLSTSITTSLFRAISTGNAEEAVSTFAFSLVQPLMRGAGRRVALENLTQAERNMVYAIRNFIRFRRTFSVDIAQSYFDLLRLRDEVENRKSNYENLVRELERAELRAKAGIIPEFQVDQQRQQVLTAEDSWIRAQQNYADALDRFKIDLGLPMEIPLQPDPRELKMLREIPIEPLELEVDEANAIALIRRLDLKNDSDAVEDAERKVVVARDNLRPGLDLFVDFNAPTEGVRQPLNFADGDPSYSVGADLDLPLERTSERNVYRDALIDVKQAHRNLNESMDLIQLEIRRSVRALQQARASYEIQKNSLGLAERRVESTTILLQAGRATSRDYLEAQDDFLDAQNALTLALVNHFNARLDLLLAMETLALDERGFWLTDDAAESIDLLIQEGREIEP